MDIHELNRNLDKAISEYQDSSGKACQYCSDDNTGDAFFASHQATVKLFSDFKNEILTYLSQHIQ